MDIESLIEQWKQVAKSDQNLQDRGIRFDVATYHVDGNEVTIRLSVLLDRAGCRAIARHLQEYLAEHDIAAEVTVENNNWYLG